MSRKAWLGSKRRLVTCLGLLVCLSFTSQGVAAAAQAGPQGPAAAGAAAAPAKAATTTTTTSLPATTTTTSTAPTTTSTTRATTTTTTAPTTTTTAAPAKPAQASSGTSAAAAESCPVPAAPTGLAAVAGANRATVTWTAAADNGSPITRYLVTAVAGTVAKNAEATDGAATSVVLSGLPGGTAHTFKVVATSGCGDGPAATSPAVTPTGAASTYVSSVLANAPVAYYRLGEGSGPTAADSSGKGRHATYEQVALGSPGAVRGDPDTAVGANGYNSVATSTPSLPVSNSGRSVSAWVKPADGYNRYVAGWGVHGTRQEFSVFVGPTTVGVVAYGDDRYFTTPRPLNDGAWHHVAVTYDGASLVAYLDGLSLGTKTFAAPLDTLTGSGLRIGARAQGYEVFYGDLDEVAVFPAALTAAQVGGHFSAAGYSRPAAVTQLAATAGANEATVAWTAAASPTPVTRYVVTAYAGTVAKGAQATEGSNTSVVISGLAGGVPHTFQVVASNAYGDGPAATSTAVTPTGPATTYASSVIAAAPSAYYRLGETSGTTAADSSGKGRHGTYEQVGLGSPGAVTGDPDTAFDASQWAPIATSRPSLPLSNAARSVEAWVKPTDPSNRYVVSWGDGGAGQEFSLLVGATTVGVVVRDDDRYFASPRALNDGAWHHVVVTYTGTSITAYLDGASLGTKTFTGPLDTLDSAGMRIGARFQGEAPFYGQLDEVAVFPTALTAAQVTAHFSAGGYGAPAAVTDLVATPGSNEATVAWTAPASATPITRYVVTAFAGTVAKNARATDGSNTSIVISGLPGGVAHTFQVVASNAYGDGPVATSPAVTPTGSTTTYASSVLAAAPSAYYRLGETSGTTAADSSGKGRHGTYGQVALGAPGAVTGDPDTAVTHDGGSRALRSSPVLPTSNSARSVAAWVKPADGYDRYVASWGASGARQEFSLVVGGVSVGVVVDGDDRYFPTPRRLDDGAWHHVVVTYTGTTLTAYLDGVALGTRTFGAPLDTLDVAGLHVGAGFAGQSTFYGTLDDVAVFPTALTAAQVAAHFAAAGHGAPVPVTGVTATAGTNSVQVSWTPDPSPVVPVSRYVVTAYAGTVAKNAEATDGTNTNVNVSGLSGGTAYTFQVVASNAYGDGAAATSAAVTPSGPATTYASSVLANGPSAYYRLGDTSGRTAADSSGKGRHGLYDQATLGSTGSVIGDPDTAAGANGTCCIARSSPTLPAGNTARSVEAWVKPSDASLRYIAGWGTDATGRAFSLGTEGGRITVSAAYDDRSWNTPGPLNDGAWHHVVVTYSGMTLTAYLDGLPLGTRTFSASLNTLDNSGLVIGADFRRNAPFYGGLDEVAVYPTALTSANVAAHFAASGLSRPAAVANVTATPGANQATVSWSPAPSPNSPVTRYVVTAFAGTVAKNAEATKGTSLVISGLAGGSAYTFRVVAANAYGDGAAATSAAVTPTGPATTYASSVLANAPSAYYRLGDTSGKTAADSSGKGRHALYDQATLGTPGAAVGDPDTSAGANGSCCVARSTPVLPAGNTARSVEAWVKPSDASFRSVAGWGNAAANRSFSLGVGGGRIGVSVSGDDRYWNTPGPLNDGAWHHVVVTYSGTTLTAYLDGLSLGTRTFAASLSTLDDSGLVIGADYATSSPFYGGLDEVAVYPVALTASNVTAHFSASGFSRPAAVTNVTATPGANQATVSWSAASSPNSPVTRYVVTAFAGTVAKNAEATKGTSIVISGLAGGTAYTFRVVPANAYGDGTTATSAAVTPTGAATTYVTKVLANGPSAYYRFGEGAGKTAADSSGKGRHGLYDQATLGSPGAIAGDPDSSAGANGNCCVATSSPALPVANGARSLEAWVKPADANFRYIAGWGGAATDRSFSVGLDSSNVGVIAYNDDRYFALPSPLNDGAWHYVVVTYNGTHVVVYVDGVSLGTQTFSAPLATLASSGLVVGADFQGGAPFYGSLDEVAVYPVALTAAQIGAQAGPPPPPPDGPPAPPCPVPAAPSAVTAVAGANQATVSWSAAADNGTPLTRYMVTAYAGTTAKNAEARDGLATGLVMSGLSAGTAYTFQVRASSDCGEGPARASSAVTPTGSSATYASSVLADGPSVYYRLGDESGPSAADSSGKGNHATYEYATLAGPGALVGDPDTSVAGNGSGSVSYSSPTLPLYNSARSVEAWVKPADATSRYVASWGAFGQNQEFSVLVGPTAIGVVAYNDDRYFSTPRPLNDGAWHHVVLTYDGTTLTAYLDGISIGTRTFAAPLDTFGGQQLRIGSRLQGEAPLNGGLDEVALYPTALTAAQVGAHFAASDYAPPTAPRAVTASYAGDNRLTVSWGIATSANSPVTRYLVTAYVGTTPQNSIAVAGTKTAVRMAGLPAGTTYTFQVVASNAYGDGPAATSPAATASGAPTTYASSVLSNAPSAYYRLGETSGFTAADSSGKGRHGTFEQPTLGLPGAVGDTDTAVKNDGWARVARAAPALPLSNAARSVEAWVKLTAAGGYVASWGNSGKDQEFSLLVGSSNVAVRAYDDDRSFPTPRPIDDGAWHHVVTTYDGTTLTAYLDGLSLGTRTFAAALDTVDASGLHIGARFTGEAPFLGQLDEVAVYPTALSAATVAAHFAASGSSRPAAVTGVNVTPGTNQVEVSWTPDPSPAAPVTGYVVTAYAGTVAKNAEATDGASSSVVISGLSGGTSYTFRIVAKNAYGDGAVATSAAVTPSGPAVTYASNVLTDLPAAYYRLGEVSGRTAADSSGKGRHGTYGAAALGTAGAVVGDPDTAVTSDGTCCIAASTPVLPVANAARSVEAMVKPADGNTHYVAGWGTYGTRQEFSVFVGNSTIGVVAYNDDRYFTTPRPLHDGAWHHIVVVYTGSSLVVYLDGASLGTKTFSAPLDTLDSSGLRIGARFDGGSPFAGGLDDVAVYPIALSTTQVTAHFANTGFGRPGSVANATVTPGANEATVSWSAAASSTPITRYVVTAFAGGVAKNAEATDGSSTSVVVSGLPGGTSHTFRVMASNAYGDGPVTTTPAVTPTGPATTYASSVLANGPSAYYRLGDTAGGTAADSSGKGGHGLYDRATLGSSGAVVGDPDSAVEANGACCVAKASPALPAGNGARSVEAWVKPADTYFRYIAGWGTAATDRAFSIGFDGSNIAVIAYNDDRYFPLPRPLNDGAWHHVVVTYSGTSVVAYLDGIALGTKSFVAPLTTPSSSPLVIGADFRGYSPFYGGLDEVAVYPTALSSTSVAAHFAASGYSRPAAVANVTAVPGANQATVSWTGASSPNSPVTRYVVTAYAGTVARNAEATDGSNSSLVISGLSGATPYTFQVMASNAYGSGAAATSAAVTPSGPGTTYASSVLANAPSAYYRLGDTAGTTAADSSGKGAHGAYDRATLASAGGIVGDPDTSAAADGGCCLARAKPSLPAANTARSVEAWVKPTDTSFRYIAGWGTAANDRSFSVGLDGSSIGVIAYNDDRYFALPRPLNDGAWHHVVVTYTGSTLTVYLDGISLGAKSFSSPLATLGSTSLIIGADFQGAGPFYGELDEVAVYPTALTAANVTAHFAASGYSRPAAVPNVAAAAGANQATVSWTGASSPNSPVTRYVVTAYAGTVAKNSEATSGANTSLVISGLSGGTAYTFRVMASNAYGDGPVGTSPAVTPTGTATTYASSVLANTPSAYYRLGDTSGKTAADSSGKGRHAVYDEATLGSAGAVVGDPDAAVQGNGGCCIATSSPTLPANNSARSVEAWVKPGDTGFRYIAGWGTAATDRGFSVSLDGSNIGVIAYGDDLYFALPSALDNGAWHHIVVTYNGTNVVVYLDGVSLGSQAFASPLATYGPSPLVIGADFQGSGPFYGGLDEVAVYPVALTAAQVTAHYNAKP